VISPEERAELVARLKLALDDPNNVAGGSTPNYPTVWYLTAENFARDARLVGFYRDRAICVVGDRPFCPEAHLVFASHEAAVIDSADRLKGRIAELTSEYLAACKACHGFIMDAQKAKKAERDATKKPK